MVGADNKIAENMLNILTTDVSDLAECGEWAIFHPQLDPEHCWLWSSKLCLILPSFCPINGHPSIGHMMLQLTNHLSNSDTICIHSAHDSFLQKLQFLKTMKFYCTLGIFHHWYLALALWGLTLRVEGFLNCTKSKTNRFEWINEIKFEIQGTCISSI